MIGRGKGEYVHARVKRHCPQAGHGWSCPQDKVESKIVYLLIANVILYVISNYV